MVFSKAEGTGEEQGLPKPCLPHSSWPESLNVSVASVRHRRRHFFFLGYENSYMKALTCRTSGTVYGVSGFIKVGELT